MISQDSGREKSLNQEENWTTNRKDSSKELYNWNEINDKSKGFIQGINLGRKSKNIRKSESKKNFIFYKRKYI